MFNIGDTVILASNSFEDSGLFEGDTGTVAKTNGNDIRVTWDNGSDDCWISSSEFI